MSPIFLNNAMQTFIFVHVTQGNVEYPKYNIRKNVPQAAQFNNILVYLVKITLSKLNYLYWFQSDIYSTKYHHFQLMQTLRIFSSRSSFTLTLPRRASNSYLSQMQIINSVTSLHNFNNYCDVGITKIISSFNITFLCKFYQPFFMSQWIRNWAYSGKQEKNSYHLSTALSNWCWLNG